MGLSFKNLRQQYKFLYHLERVQCQVTKQPDCKQSFEHSHKLQPKPEG